MDKTILITDRDTPLGAAAVKAASSRGYKILTTVQTSRTEDSEETPAPQNPVQGNIKEITWNRRSPVSAKTVLLEARRYLGSLSNVLLIYSIEKTMQAFHTMSMEDVEERVDRKIKGSIFLVRELLRHYHNEEAGILGLAVDQTYSDDHSPLDSAATGAYKAFADSVLRFYQKDQFYFTGFQTTSPDVESYAGFILDTLEARPEKASGEWLRHSPKQGGLFNTLPIIKRHKS